MATCMLYTNEDYAITCLETNLQLAVGSKLKYYFNINKAKNKQRELECSYTRDNNSLKMLGAPFGISLLLILLYFTKCVHSGDVRCGSSYGYA